MDRRRRPIEGRGRHPIERLFQAGAAQRATGMLVETIMAHEPAWRMSAIGTRPAIAAREPFSMAGWFGSAPLGCATRTQRRELGAWAPARPCARIGEPEADPVIKRDVARGRGEIEI